MAATIESPSKVHQLSWPGLNLVPVPWRERSLNRLFILPATDTKVFSDRQRLSRIDDATPRLLSR